MEEMLADAHRPHRWRRSARDIERDKILTAEEAMEYGLIDEVLRPAQDGRDRVRPADPARDAVAAATLRQVEARAHRTRHRGTRRRVGTDQAVPSRARSGPRCRHDRASLVRRRGDLTRWHASVTAVTCSSARSAGRARSRSRSSSPVPGVYICDECIDLCNEIIEEELSESSELEVRRAAEAAGDLRVPRRVRHRTGRAKKALAVAVYNHYKRVQAGGEPAAAGRGRRAGQVQHPADRPDRLRQDATSPRRWPGCSTCRSPSPTPPR